MTSIEDLIEVACGAITDRTGYRWPDSFDEGEQETARANMRAAIAAVFAEAGISLSTTWPIDTDDQVEALASECSWNNRRYMTPEDYRIWCDRMRKFALLASGSLSVEYAKLNHEIARFKSDRLYVVGWNDGFNHAANGGDE